MRTAAVPSRRSGLLVSLVLALVLGITPLGPAPALAQPEEPVDIVFALDGSGSISSSDWALQRDGFSAALRDQAAFPLDGSVRIGVVQWARSTTRVEVPLTAIVDQGSVDALADDIQGLTQIGGNTNPGDGLRTSADLLAAGDRRPAQWTVCMSTDGTTNAGESLESASKHAQDVGADRYSVIGIQDGGFTEPVALAHYGPHVFGGGSVAFARNTTEFTSLIIGTCLNDPIELVGLEVNQSIQSWTNDITLIDGKRTVVRAFAQTQPGGDTERVTGRLYGTRDGSPLRGSPLAAINVGGSVLVDEDVTDRREELDASFNFQLPPSWTSGEVTLRFDGGGTPVQCSEAAGPTANDCSTTVSFETMPRPAVKVVGIKYESGGTEFLPTRQQRWEQGFRMESLFPVDRIDISTASLSGSWDAPPPLADVNRRLSNRRAWDLCFSIFGCNDLYYGVVQGVGGGLANGIPGTVSSGYTRGTDNRADAGFFRNVGGHEVGHSLGLSHAVDDSLPTLGGGVQQGRCGERASSTAVAHPYFGTLSGSEGSTMGPLLSERGDPDTEVWGLDTRFIRNDVNDLAVVDPNVTGALLGYCWVGSPQDLWTSAHEWDLLIDGFEATFGTASAITPQSEHTSEGRHLIVSGAIDDLEADPQTVRFDPVGVVEATFPVPAEGPYALHVLDDDGEVVATTSFDIEELHARVAPGEQEPPDTGMFVVPVPIGDAAYDRIEVELAGDVLGVLTASDNAPTVDLVAPQAGSVQDQPTVEVVWDATDDDGDALTSVVRYSPDEGVTWQTLAIDLEGQRFEADRSELASSTTAVFEVVVSDGVLSSSARTAPFTVVGDGPLVLIESPQEGEAFYSGIQTISLEATASDELDGRLDGSSVVWTSDLDGEIAQGAGTTVTADQLRVGTHVLTASATNSSGETGQASVAIDVVRVPPPPPPPPPAPPADDPAPPSSGPVFIPQDDEEDPAPGLGACPVFPDLGQDNVHLDAVCAMVLDQLLLGYADGTFRPGASVTRGQVASVLVRGSELEPIDPGRPSFTDTGGSVHAPAIEALHLAGMVAGFPDNTFRPNQPIQRDQLASVLAAWLEIDGRASGPFTDVPASNVHLDAINALHAEGVVRGVTSTTYEPGAPVRRDQFAAFVDRARDTPAE